MPDLKDLHSDLAAQAVVFTRYLVGRDPPPEFIERYQRACRVLFPDPLSPEDASVLRYVRRHPWSTGCLDAAAGLLCPTSALRARIITMAAILEASTTCADDFLPRSLSRLRLFATIAIAGLASVLKLAAGSILLLRARSASEGPHQ